MQLSVETGRPVRVIRGAGASEYAPLDGYESLFLCALLHSQSLSHRYRYDGLYIVERVRVCLVVTPNILIFVHQAYMGKSPKGFNQCRFFLRVCLDSVVP